MKNSKRMIAVIAASGLALGTMPGVANAQSELLDLNLGTGLLGGSVDLGLDLFVGSTGAESPLTGSLEGISGSLDAEDGSLSDLTGSASGSLDAEDGSLSDLTGSASGSLDAED
ncbi:MAG: hypothetical protein U1C73_08670, partial [Dietzia sp.]|nr:hypothetical protein [Dietzia sp.]